MIAYASAGDLRFRELRHVAVSRTRPDWNRRQQRKQSGAESASRPSHCALDLLSSLEIHVELLHRGGNAVASSPCRPLALSSYFPDLWPPTSGPFPSSAYQVFHFASRCNLLAREYLAALFDGFFGRGGKNHFGGCMPRAEMLLGLSRGTLVVNSGRLLLGPLRTPDRRSQLARLALLPVVYRRIVTLSTIDAQRFATGLCFTRRRCGRHEG